jgi:hypothetical protein
MAREPIPTNPDLQPKTQPLEVPEPEPDMDPETPPLGKL